MKTSKRIVVASVATVFLGGLIPAGVAAYGPGVSSRSALAAYYSDLCGGCHMAYPPSLLPARSWDHLMGELPAHFGTKVKMDEDGLHKVGRYLAEHASDRSGGALAKRISASVPPGAKPIRISAMRVIEDEHRALGGRYLIAVPGISTISGCDSCHVGAERGRFDEVNLPQSAAADEDSAT